MAERVLLEGRPGVGKTTAVRRLLELLERRGASVRGFLTTEIREGGRRVGFALEVVGGERGVLAHVELSGPPRVSRYGVDLDALERLTLPVLRQARGGVVVIDELGKMELASEAFRKEVATLLERSVTVVATVQATKHPFTDELKRRPGIETLRVTRANRDELPDRLARRLGP